MSLYVERIPNRNSPPAILLRESQRIDGKVRRRTLANLSKLPPELVASIRLVLKGGRVFNTPELAFAIRRALPHGHVHAIVNLCRQLGLARILARKKSRERDLALAAIVARLIDPASKLATARQLSPETASSSLGAVLELGAVTGNEMLAMLDWLHRRQTWIERSLANRHLRGKTLILYDVSSSFVEGACCELAAFGHNRDGKKGKKQITFGLLCAPDGCPVAVEVFAGNTSDPATVASQVQSIQTRFAIDKVALVGDRGMLTTARIRDDPIPAGLDWILALKTADIRTLLQGGKDGTAAPLCPEALVADAVAEITGPEFPGERLMVCLNPRLRGQRARKREDLLKATEEALSKIAHTAARTKPGPKNRDAINRALGARAGRWKMRKHFDIEVRDDAMTWSRNQDRIDAEARLDGIYIIRTSLSREAIGIAQAVEAYKSLAQVERAFRSIKTTRLKIRPVYVYNTARVRAHVFLCMLAWYVEWHLRHRLAPLLFEDHDRDAARRQRTSPVAKANVSDAAKDKAGRKRTQDDLPVHSLHTLLADLATLTLNEVTTAAQPDHPFTLVARPTALQTAAFELLGADSPRHDSITVTG